MRIDLKQNDIELNNYDLVNYEKYTIAKQIAALRDIQSNSRVMDNLGNIDWSFSKACTNYLSHSIHPYPCKFIPQIPANLIVALSMPGEIVWDPFGGSGTTAFESLRLGRHAISTDANPVATLIARAKCVTLKPEQIQELNSLAEHILIMGSNKTDIIQILDQISNELSQYKPDIPNINKWFHTRSIPELCYIKYCISKLDEESYIFASACFSAIIVKASLQDSETRYSSKPRNVDVGETLSLFGIHLKKSIEKHRSVFHVLGYRHAEIDTVDLRTLSKNKLKTNYNLSDESVDLIVTSPPYANATDYHLYHRFRLYWLGYQPRELASCEIGSHLRHQRENKGYDLYLNEMKTCLEAMYRCLRPGRFSVLVVGDSIFEGILHDTTSELLKISSQIGFDVLGEIERPIHDTKRSFINVARRASTERLLILRKKPVKLRISLYPPPYKRWKYEENLAIDEIQSLIKQPIEKNSNGIFKLESDPFCIDQLKRLTFTHCISFNRGSDIRTWQSILENGDTQLGKRVKDPKYLTHGIHAYKGKFYPQLAKCLFNIGGVEPGDVILDPFCGSGTVLLEAFLNGFNSYGIEMNPCAVMIAKAKTELPAQDSYMIDRLLHNFLESIKNNNSSEIDLSAFPENCIEEIKSWFPLNVAQCIGWFLNEIKKVPSIAVQDCLKTCLSSIIREISQQDPRDLRIRRRKEFIIDAPAHELFISRIVEMRNRLRSFAQRKIHAPNFGKQPIIYSGDNRLWSSYINCGLTDKSVDLIVTSPPYATALPYIDTDRLSILTILGMDTSQRAPIEYYLTGSREINKMDKKYLEQEILSLNAFSFGSATAVTLVKKIYELNKTSNVGFRRQNTAALVLRYFQDIYSTLKCLSRVLKTNGKAFIVIGNNKTIAGEQTVIINSTKAIEEMGCTIGWKHERTIPISVTTEDLSHIKNAITENQIICFSN